MPPPPPPPPVNTKFHITTSASVIEHPLPQSPSKYAHSEGLTPDMVSVVLTVRFAVYSVAPG